MIIKEICKEQIKELASMYMDAFNRPPWNDKWSIESATTRISFSYVKELNYNK